MKSIIQFLALVIIYLITWIIGMMIGFALFPSQAVAEQAGFDINLITVSFLHAAILFMFVKYARTSHWDLFWSVAAVSFGLTYFITQIETIWFNNTIQMDQQLLKSLLCGGLLSSLIFTGLAVVITGKTKPQIRQRYSFSFRANFIIRWLVLIVIIWPMIYFTAGYYIAWQFADVRIFYSGSDELLSFTEMMKANLADGLYTFQVIRSLAWIGLGYIIFNTLRGNPLWTQMILTGGLFAILGSSQLLLDNALMPETVRYAHLLETLVSTFIWGLIVSFLFNRIEHPVRVITV
jgi:hypothetical protein